MANFFPCRHIMEALLGPTLLSKSGPVSSAQGLQPDLILLYFSASWCGPCRAFTPRLQMFYETVNDMEKQVEVIFVSRDRNPDEFAGYYEEMPWLAVPFAEQDKINALRETCRVAGIPKLVLMRKDGTLASETCRGDVEQKGPLALAAWRRLVSS